MGPDNYEFFGGKARFDEIVKLTKEKSAKTRD